jgi:hypothetical protein
MKPAPLLKYNLKTHLYNEPISRTAVAEHKNFAVLYCESKVCASQWWNLRVKHVNINTPPLYKLRH